MSGQSELVGHGDPIAIRWDDGKTSWADIRVTPDEFSARAQKLGSLAAAVNVEPVVYIDGYWDVSMAWGLKVLGELADAGITHLVPTRPAVPPRPRWD